MSKRRGGVTLIEVIVAMLIFSIGALGLAASSATIARQVTTSLLRSRSAMIARTRSERAQSQGCASLSGGAETSQGISSTWTVTNGESASMDQNLERRTASGVRVDRFYSALPCG